MATRRPTRSTSCRTPRRRSSTDRWPTCRGCRSCRIRISTAMWSSWVELNPQTAAKLGIADGDMVEIALGAWHGARAGRALARHRTRCDCDARRPGPRDFHAIRERPRRAIPIAILGADDRAGDGRAGVGRDTREDYARRRPDGRLVRFAAAPEEQTRTEPSRSEDASMATPLGDGRRSRSLHGLRRLRGGVPCRKQHPDRGPGSGVPRARDALASRRALLGRRISGRASAFRPVMCQQCDAAPCEPVCPTYASHHTEEGLNAQVYNRCIGTRYCANACPYNVAVLQLLQPGWDKPLHLQFNPDVSVREVGVMEKCTFCVQRIKAPRSRSKAENRPTEGRRDQARVRAVVHRRRRWCSAISTIRRAKCRGSRDRRAARSCSRTSARSPTSPISKRQAQA